MKTQNNKLGFSKNSLIELNDSDMLDVNAGASVSIYVGHDDETQLQIDVTIFW